MLRCKDSPTSIAGTVRKTEHAQNGRRPLSWTARYAGLVAAGCLSVVTLLVLAGCSSGSQAASPGAGGTDASPTVGAHMAGPAAEVHISQAMLDAAPKHWVLTTPESAVRSYLDWTSYAYRTGQSQFATATMTSYEEVRVDSYIQYNIERGRLIDETLQSITFGTPSVGSTSTVIPAKEKWTYRYLSTETGNKILAGPYSASYDSVYTVVKGKNGDWVVDAVKATPQGTVK